MKNTLMEKVFKGMVVVLCVMVLSGCATIGTKQITKREIVSQIKEGKSTKADVKALLGEPSNISFTDAGEEDWSYCYSRATTRPATFIPIIGIFTGGADTETHTLTIRFTKEGIVEKIGKGRTTGSSGMFD